MARLPPAGPVVLGGASVAAACSPRLGSRRRSTQRVRPATRRASVRSPGRPAAQWEYMQLPCLPVGEPTGHRREFEERLNEQGKRGWEMISLLDMDQPPNRGCLLATFKRQILN